MSSSRHAWVDYSKGICIIGVVTLYAVWKMQEELGAAGGGWMQNWVDFARPFRMPDFFLLSGLFLARVIERPWREYLDKKVLHYLYFFWLWSLIYFGLKLVVGRAGATPAELLADLGTSLYQPFAMLWFIEVLPIFFVLTRLTRRVPWWLIVPAGLLLQASNFGSEDWLLVGHCCERFIYFYIGYRFAPAFFAIADWARRNAGIALALLLGWAAVNQALVATHIAGEPGIAVLAGLAGCSAVIVAGVLLSRFAWMDWLRYLGEHSIVTYLAFFAPMGLLVVVMRQTGLWFDPGSTAALMSVASVLVALSLYWATRRGPARWLFERPAWAQRAAPRRSAPPASQPAAKPVGSSATLPPPCV